MSFFGNLFKKKTIAAIEDGDSLMADEKDAQAAHAKKIEEKIKHYQAHGKPKTGLKSAGVDDPSFNENANQLAKEDYNSLLSRAPSSINTQKGTGKSEKK